MEHGYYTNCVTWLVRVIDLSSRAQHPLNLLDEIKQVGKTGRTSQALAEGNPNLHSSRTCYGNMSRKRRIKRICWENDLCGWTFQELVRGEPQSPGEHGKRS
jgi:hypothetical protein